MLPYTYWIMEGQMLFSNDKVKLAKSEVGRFRIMWVDISSTRLLLTSIVYQQHGVTLSLCAYCMAVACISWYVIFWPYLRVLVKTLTFEIFCFYIFLCSLKSLRLNSRKVNTFIIPSTISGSILKNNLNEPCIIFIILLSTLHWSSPL